MTTLPFESSTYSAPSRRRIPLTLWIGLGAIVLCEVMLFTDVRLSSRWAVRNPAERLAVVAPRGTLAQVARYVASNMTAIAWVCYIIFLEGVLTWRTGASAVRRRPHHFIILCLASIFIWCVFDIINFNLGMKAWHYIGMSPDPLGRATGYFLAFATIVPGMVMSGQVLLELGLFNWAQSKAGGFRMPHWALWASLIVGLWMLGWVLWTRNPVTNFVMWTSLVFLLDPINYWLGRPSMWRDFERGWFGRTLAACAGGAICGLLWEFWNFWALAKWTYHLPFLGVTEQIKYFEMPIVGFLGFIPFGIECWVMWQLIRIPFDGFVEPLPNDRQLL